MAEDVGSTRSGLERNPMLQDGQGNLDAPKTVIPSVRVARGLYYKFRSDHLKRIQLYAAIEGLIAGNPPYDPVELARSGLGHIANFNNLDARSFFERSALAYWNLITQAETICKFEIRGFENESQGDKAFLVKTAQTMARHWNDVVREWPSFYTLVNTLTGQLVKFGLSPALWPDERDWRWRTVEVSRFFVPDQASTDIKQLTNLAVETSFTVQSLYENWKELDDMGKEKAEKTGWNKESLAKLIVYYANTWMKPSNEFTDVMDFQRRYQDSDLNFGPIYSDDVRIVSLFSREYDGSFTHYMFDRIHDTGDFIFKAESQYKSLEEALVIFTASPGEFTLHSNRGLGHKIFSGSQALMQLDCSLVDGARWAATILLKSPSTGAYDAEAIQFFPGVPTNIGSAEFQQNNLGANLDHLVGVSQHIYQKLNFNTANSGDDPGVPDRNVGSMAPEQARMNSIKEFSVLKNNISHFYAQFDHVIENMVIKMLHSKNGYPGYDTCKEWKRRCIADGVPEQMFETKGAKANEMPRHLRAKATRVAGDGSTLALIVGIQTMMATFGGSLGPREASEVKRMMITSLFGAEYVDVFMQDQDRVDEKSGGASVAGLENNTMQEGKAPVFSPDNEHRSHIVLHMGLGMQIVDQLGKQAISPVDADRVFRSLVPHLREHIDFLSQSIFAQSFLAGIEQPFRQLEDYAKLMRKNAARMIQAEQKRRAKEAEKQQEVMRDADRKDWVAQRDAERADMKVEAQIERAKEASDTRAGIQRQDTQNKASNERLKIQLDAKNETFKNMTDADLERERQLIAGNTIAPYDIEDNPKE